MFNTIWGCVRIQSTSSRRSRRAQAKTIRANDGQYRDALTEVLDEHQAVEGDGFNFLRRERGARDDKYEHELFQGAIIARSPKLSFKLEPFYASPHAVEAIEQLTRLAKNRLRERLKIPLVGEGWVSETSAPVT